MMDKVHEAHPDAQLYWTEGGPDYTAPDYATDWANWGKTFTQATRHWCQALSGWNLALDEKGRAEHRAISLRRDGHDPFPDEGDHAEWSVLGVHAFLPQCAARGQEVRIRLPDWRALSKSLSKILMGRKFWS